MNKLLTTLLKTTGEVIGDITEQIAGTEPTDPAILRREFEVAHKLIDLCSDLAGVGSTGAGSAAPRPAGQQFAQNLAR